MTDPHQLPEKLGEALVARNYDRLKAADIKKFMKDNLLGAIGCIPVVGAWIAGAVGGGLSYSDAALFRKIVSFIYEIKDTTFDERTRFVDEIERTAYDTAGSVICEMISRMDNINKATVVANLVKARIKQAITIEEFFRLSAVCERIPYADFKYLKQFEDEAMVGGGVTEILYASGALIKRTIGDDENTYTLSVSGRKLLKYGLSSDVALDVKNATYIPTIGVEDVDRMWRDLNDNQAQFDLDIARGK